MTELQHITDHLFSNAEKFPDKLALHHDSGSWTWGQLAGEVSQCSDAIRSLLPGAEQSIVSILLPNTPEFIFLYLGTLHAGHIAMPLDPNFKAMEVQAVIERMNPELILTDETYRELFAGVDGNHIYTLETLTSSMSRTPVLAKPLRFAPEQQVASMLFTSGTTGNPKAVPYSHANHLWNIFAVTDLWQWTADDTILLSLPLSHWHGLVMALDGSLVHSNTMYLQTWFEPAATLQALTSGDISLFMHVPIAYSKLITHDPETDYDLSKVRLCISGSSFMPPKLWHQFKARFGHDILERYGANEMGLLASNTLEQRKPGSVGFLLEDVEMKLTDSGEIAMKSPGLFAGYWKNEEATASQRLDDGFWLSGDIAEIEADGRIWLKGRVQEKMKKSGYTVYPRDVEWAMMQHPDIREVVVLSIQNDELSDRFIFFIVGDISEASAFEYAKANLPFFWRPDVVKLLSEIPKTGRTSKPAIRELRETITRELK